MKATITFFAIGDNKEINLKLTKPFGDSEQVKKKLIKLFKVDDLDFDLIGLNEENNTIRILINELNIISNPFDYNLITHEHEHNICDNCDVELKGDLCPICLQYK